MASHLKIKDNEARCYCSVHQGADIARGTLERVVHRYPLRHAHTWLWKWNAKTKTLLPPEPIELRAMICCGLTKEMLPLPTDIKIHPAVDFLKNLLAEADIVPDDDIQVRPGVTVYGRCEQCQTMLSECPTEKDVGLGATEVMYVMMPPEWCEPVDWSACEEGCSERA